MKLEFKSCNGNARNAKLRAIGRLEDFRCCRPNLTAIYSSLPFGKDPEWKKQDGADEFEDEVDGQSHDSKR